MVTRGDGDVDLVEAIEKYKIITPKNMGIRTAQDYAIIRVCLDEHTPKPAVPVTITLPKSEAINTQPPCVDPKRLGSTWTVSVEFEGQRFRERCNLLQTKSIRKLVESAEREFLSKGWNQVQSDLLFARLNAEAEEFAEDGDEQSKSLTQQIIDLVRDEGDLFRDGDKNPYLSFSVDAIQMTYALQSMAARSAIRQLVYIAFEKGISDATLDDIICQLSAIAIHDGTVKKVFMRSGSDDDVDYIDLGDDTWRVIRLACDGWRVAEAKDCPVRFYRVDTLQPLPMPSPTSDCRFDELRSFINCPGDEEWYLLSSWIVQAMRPKGPYPILCVSGEQGSAKSTLAEFVRMLIDPNKANLRRPPKEDRDIGVAARNSKLLCYENISKLSDSMADTFCTVATGGGFAERQLYSNGEEFVFNTCNPIMLNGISGLLTRGDVADRAINLHLPTIDAAQRKTAEKLKADFGESWSRILGGFCTLYCHVKRELPQIQLDEMPRMADFARLGVAVERIAGWESGSFLNAYDANREASNEAVLDDSNLPAVMSRFLDQHFGRYQGTGSQLLEAMSEFFPDQLRPRTPSALSALLTRLSPALRTAGFFIRRKTVQGSRIWELSRPAQDDGEIL